VRSSEERSKRDSFSTCAEPVQRTAAPVGTCRPASDSLERSANDLHWHVERPDGESYDIRPISPDDGARLRAFHAGLSRRTSYLRFFIVHPELSDFEVERFTNVDQESRLALVATRGESLIAVGRFDRTPETSGAEVAFVVADAFQHRGIGSLLLDLLAAAATERGITAFTAETLAENRSMLDVVNHSGFPVTSRRDRASVALEFPIAPTALYTSTLAVRRRNITLHQHLDDDTPK
jgi:GNAT superfamily N-acetyltransferase